MDFTRCTWNYDEIKKFSSLLTSSRLCSIKCLKYSQYERSDYDFIALNGMLSQLPFLLELNLFTKKVLCGISHWFNLPQFSVLKICLPLAPSSHPEDVVKLFCSRKIKQVYVNNCIYSSCKYCNYAMWRKWS